MAAQADAMEVGEEQLLLGEEGAVDHAQGAWRLRPKLLVPLLAAGLCGTALYALAPAGQTPAAVPASSNMAVQMLDEVKADTKERKKLLIEQDMSQFVAQGGQPPPAAVLSSAGGATAELPDAAGNMFDHVVQTSGVDKELTEKELAAYKQRFVASMIAMPGANNWWVADYVGSAMSNIELTKPVMTHALASAVNDAQSSYTVKMQDWMLDESQEVYNSRLGRTAFTPEGDVMDRVSHGTFGKKDTDREVLPEAFDSREHWPKCADVIGRIHNQGRCGDCWVFGAMGPLDSRLCIHTDGKFSGKNAWLSRGMGASCAVKYNGCNGGWEYYVYQYIEKSKGIVTEACNPYFAGTDYAHHWDAHMAAPACPTTCESKYGRSFEQDLFRPLGVQGYRLVLKPNEDGIEDMKREIMKGGPVAFGIYAENVFMGYSGGIYNSACGQSANHAVHTIGWGKGYILGQNSWGTSWGLEGRFQVAHCVPTDFTVPGPITADSYPLPLP